MSSWKELREQRMSESGAQSGYARARRAYEIGCQVRALRTDRGLTQAELAAMVGTSQAAIARLEAGGSEPRLSTLETIGAALGRKLIVEFTSA